MSRFCWRRRRSDVLARVARGGHGYDAGTVGVVLVDRNALNEADLAAIEARCASQETTLSERDREDLLRLVDEVRRLWAIEAALREAETAMTWRRYVDV